MQTSASVAAGTDGVNPNLRARRQVVTMLGTVVVFFFICLLPFRIFTLWFILAADEDIENFGIETYYHVLNFCRVMFYLNSAINPILYNVMSSKFRTAFLKALGFNWAGRRKRLLRHLSRQSTFNTTTTSGNATTSTSQTTSEGGTGGQRELIKRLTKEALMEDAAAGPCRPMLQKYGRQGSCTANRASSKFLSSAVATDSSASASSKPLLAATLSTTTASANQGNASRQNDSNV